MKNTCRYLCYAMMARSKGWWIVSARADQLNAVSFWVRVQKFIFNLKTVCHSTYKSTPQSQRSPSTPSLNKSFSFLLVQLKSYEHETIKFTRSQLKVKPKKSLKRAEREFMFIRVLLKFTLAFKSSNAVWGEECLFKAAKEMCLTKVAF